MRTQNTINDKSIIIEILTEKLEALRAEFSVVAKKRKSLMRRCHHLEAHNSKLQQELSFLQKHYDQYALQ
jgi:FtsZ-binding cell division protein ZapB